MDNVLLGNIAELKTGPFGTQLHADEYVPDGIPVLNVRNIGYGNVITDDIDMVSNETALRLSEHLVRENDILFGRKGSIDRHAFIDTRYSGWMQGSDCIRVRITNSTVNPKYVSHYLKLDNVKKQLINGAVGSTMPSMNTDILKSIRLTLPCRETQDAIERLLSAIEQKIENNIDICSDLEAIAKILYDYWFVQFDFPDENGKPYKSSGGKMVWNEELKREIPEGWEVKCIRDICTFENGDRGDNYPKESEFVKCGVPFISGSCMTDSAIDMAAIRYITNDKADSLRSGKAIKDDLLFTLRGSLGKCIYSPFENAVINAALVIIREVGVPKSFLYMLLKSNYYQRLFHNNNNGSIQANLSVDIIGAMHCLVPAEGTLNQFDVRVNQINNAMMQKYNENQQLTSLRDFLLPMLMNGQVKCDANQ